MDDIIEEQRTDDGLEPGEPTALDINAALRQARETRRMFRFTPNPSPEEDEDPAA